VQFTDDGTVHVVKWLPGSQPKKGSLIVIPRDLPKLNITRTEDPNACALGSKRIGIQVARKSGEVRLAMSRGWDPEREGRGHHHPGADRA